MHLSLAGPALVLTLVAVPANAQTLSIVADPATASIFRLKVQDFSLVPIGVGNAKIKLEKNDPNTVVVRQEGYRDVQRSFPKDADYKDRSFTIFLSKRVVQLTTLPYDAAILVNGERKGQQKLEVEVTEGQTTTIEVTKPRFATTRRIYRWEKGGDMPPIADRIELVDRLVSITSGPEGVELLNNDTKIGDGDGDFVIKRGTCAKLLGRKAGWISKSQDWCNKENQPEPPATYRMELVGRVVNVTTPDGAGIFVNNKQVGVGSFAVQVPEKQCVQVRVSQRGFLSARREYCARDGELEAPRDDNVVLRQDASFAASVSSDQANVNVTIEVGSRFKEEQAWRLLTSIVLNYFDVLENSDAATGYLRTASQNKSWGENNANDSMVRTRIILKRASDVPLRYTVKIVSEKNKDGLPEAWSSKDDENFFPWDRVLNTYKDVISEMQARLK